MIGVFDSGVGGLTALKRLREIAPMADICFLADRENAPYGTKDEKALLRLVRRDIERLCEAGASDGILIACCTASTVYDLLPSEEREICIPIIKPTAKMAVKLSERGRIGVISTYATYKSEAFVKAISEYDRDALVISAPSTRLVALAEEGARDGEITPTQEKIIKEELLPFLNTDIDILILGCTHFTHVSRCIEKILGIKTLSASLVGAEVMAERIPKGGMGRTVFI